jgi:hypothetical protein
MGNARRDRHRAQPMIDEVHAIAFIRDQVAPGDRARYMKIVKAAIKRVWSRVVSERASTAEAITCAQDIGIWYANEVFCGRGKLELAPLPGSSEDTLH